RLRRRLSPSTLAAAWPLLGSWREAMVPPVVTRTILLMPFSLPQLSADWSDLTGSNRLRLEARRPREGRAKFEIDGVTYSLSMSRPIGPTLWPRRVEDRETSSPRRSAHPRAPGELAPSVPPPRPQRRGNVM